MPQKVPRKRRNARGCAARALSKNTVSMSPENEKLYKRCDVELRVGGPESGVFFSNLKYTGIA
jgi:hypothetical protein